ncbi:MAG: AtpZ/AtpI family protein [Sedimentisphaerales bacterium]|nr:AtpZ/AtpI family protein [Sedimentisphaerales bacterium]
MEPKASKQQDSSPKEEPSFGRESFRWIGYGFELIGVMVIFTYAGWRLDKRWDTAPWLTLALAAVAFIGMMYLLFKETAQWRK